MHIDLSEIKIEEFNLKDQIGCDYWHTNILDKNKKSISAGFAKDLESARTIAYAEYLERNAFLRIKNSSVEEKNKWGFDLIPTGCGFAVGFNLKNTILRSIGEAVERWTMSKWIDDSLYIEQVDSDAVIKSLDQASHWFVSQFDHVEFYKKTVVVEYSGNFLKYDVGFSLGYLNDGVFPGSSFNYSNSNLWQHSLLESYRHFLIFKNSQIKFGFPDNKVHYFATNAVSAKNQIKKAHGKNWPMPVIKMHSSDYNTEKKFYLARTIIDGWKSWNLGPVERFLY